jgi:hypothetical protein
MAWRNESNKQRNAGNRRRKLAAKKMAWRRNGEIVSEKSGSVSGYENRISEISKRRNEKWRLAKMAKKMSIVMA